MRSEKGEFLKQSGGLFEKEGKPCKRGLPLERASDTEPRFRGALSLAERPSLAEQSPGLFCNSLPAERTACKRFGSREKERISAEDASGGLCPLDTHKPFFEGLDPKIY